MKYIQFLLLGSVILYVTRHQNVITAEYNRQHSIKQILRYEGSFSFSKFLPVEIFMLNKLN